MTDERLKKLCKAHTPNPHIGANVILVSHRIAGVWWDGEQFLVGETEEQAHRGQTIQEAACSWYFDTLRDDLEDL